MKIIENTQFNRINLQFDEKPSKEILQKLKDEGWRYSPQHKLWYPSASAVENSRAFAESLQKDINNEASAYMESMQDAIDTNEPGFNSADERLSALVQNATDYEISPENTKVMVDNIKQQVINENESILEARLIQMEKLLLDMKAELQTTRERISKLENNNSNNNEITFPVVVLPQSSDFVESWSNNHNSVAKGLFIIKKDDKLVAIDNTDGECWVEDFDSLDKAVTYLTNSSFSPEEIRELNDADAHAAALNKLTEVDLVLINDNILNSNVFVTADIGNPVELALHNPKTGEYFLIQSIDDDDRWDYTLYDKDFKLIDGGQGVSGDITMPEDIRTAAQVVLKEFHPDDLSINDWVIRDYSDLSELINEIEAANYERVVDSIQQNWTEHDNGVEQARDERDSREMNAELSRLDAEAEAMERANGLREMEASTDSITAEIDDTGLTPEQDIRDAQIKLNNIVTETFLTLTDEEKENGTTLENKTIRYEKWYKPMVDEIMADIANGNKEALTIVQNFELDPETHVQGNKWYTAIEAFNRDVQYKLLPELYEKVQDRIKAEYEEKKIPYVVMFSSESPKFPSENKVYTVTEFNEILLQADSEFHNRKKYAEEKYGSADNYWDLERDDKLPEEDKGIQFGYDKTNFKFFNIPNPNNPEDTFSYEPSRYDIGDGNGSVFDYVRSTCSHDEFIEALNALETQLYFPGVTDSQRQFVEKTVEEATQNLKATLKEKMEDLDKAQNEYKELHKKWLIEATEADRVDEMLKNALDGVKDAYDSSMNDVFTKVLNEYPFASGDVAGSEFLKYTANEVKKMAVSELYLPIRNAQKAMNAEDYKTYNSIDWAKLRRIWEKFPANVNMTSYAEKLLQDKCAEKGMSVSENTKAVTPPKTTTEVHSDNEIPLKEFIDSDMKFDEEDTILHNKVTGKYVWLYRETGGGVGKFEYDSSFNETSRDVISYAGIKSIVRGAILEKNMDDWTILKDKRYFKPFQKTEMSEEELEAFKQSVTEEERESNINAAKAVQIENARKQYEAEQGSNYDSNLSTTDIARNLRNYIKQNHPGYKFSVTSQYFSGGSSISVKLKETPVEITNFELMKAYVEQNGDSNNNRIWDSETQKYTYYSELSEDKKKEFIEQQVRNAHWKNISEYSDDRSLAWMNEDVRKVYQDVIQHLESYNYDHSDSQSDYFSVNFYSHYGITEEAIENSHKHNVQKVRVNNESVSVPVESVEINTDVNQRLDAIINSFKESDLVLNVRKNDNKINVSIHEPESGNMIFTLNQTGNPVVPVLSNDLSMNEYEELKQLATEYFEIITENQTAPEYLENQFAKDIETKTPVQLEIISKASGILNDFDLNYDLLYQNDGEDRIQDIEQNIALKFDEAMRANGEFASIVRDLASIREDAFISDRECAALFISLENAGYLNKITETKDVVIEDVYKLINENNDKELTQEDLDICKKVVPKQQLAFTLELTKGEEGEFFTNKLKQIADTYRKINTNKELINEDGTHNVGFRYFLGDTDIFLSEIDSDGIGFGYNILNGDLQMSEWGSTSLEEILSIPYMEMDYHVPDNATIEQMLYQKHPEYFSEYAPKEELKQEVQAEGKNLSAIVHPEVSYFVASNIEFEEELFSGLSLEEALAKYEELMSEDHSGYIPCIGIDTKDGSMYDSGPEGHGQVIYAGKIIEDVLKDIKYFKKMPEYVDAMKKLTEALMANGYTVENGNEFLESHKDIIEVNGIKYNSYYNSLKTREICHNIAGDDLDKRNEAVKTMADWFINQNIIGPDDILIPAPQHTGNAEYTKEIAELVSKTTGAEIADILKCEPQEPLYEQKQAATPDLDPKLYVNGNIPEGKRLVLIDNVISTGVTFNEANKLIPGITPMVYAITDNANLRYQYEQYYAGTLKRQNYTIYQLKQDPDLHDISFASSKELKSMGKEIDFNNYEMVYSGHIDITHSMRNVNVTSEKIFEQLNNNRPDDYKAHSLSTSDIIVLENEDGTKQAMFVDDIGFLHNTPELLQFVERMNERIGPDSSISWNELEKFFDGHIKSQLASFETTKQEVIEERYDNEIQEKDETVGRMLMDNLDWHYFSDDGIDEENELSGKILEEKWSMIEDLEVRIVEGKVKTFEEAQIIINDQLLHSDLYHQVSVSKQKEEIQDIKIVDETSEIDIEPVKPLQVYTFSPFGYEGTVVQVETDLRPGIPAFDIVGLADSAVKETRERIQSAFRNSGLEFPAERVLQSLSPADLRKDAPMDLSMALGILGQTNKYPVTEPVLALGELELSGGIRPVRGAVAAVNTAKAAGIKNVVCDPTTAELLKNIDGIKILTAESLKEVNEKLLQPNVFQKTEPVIENTETVQFNEEDEWIKEALDNLQMDGHFETIRAIEIAVAGKHNILATGAPGCGKTLLTQTLMPALTPKLTEEEAKQITRINSLAGLDSPKRDNLIPPFRMPHQTATIEGMCGGGPNCRPGEVSLSHKGTLFLDETAEFRSSVIQLLRVPIESRSITLSRAGRSTTYPADFQLAMAMNPCPCGCFGSPDKICLDSARSIEQYWKKISDPLLDRVEIKTFVQKDVKDTRKISIEEMKAQIATAFEIQRKRGVYNSHMTPEDIQKYCKLDNESQAYLDKEEDKLTARKKSNLLKLSLTIANMAGREEIHINDIKEARELSAPVFEKPRQFVYDPEEQKKATVPQLDDVSITPEQIKDAENERKRITEPVLNGERTEMYTSFKNFEDKGVFEINGTHLNVSKNGGLTPTGWKQLQAAMEIYRSKKFETFRYIIINEKTGEIADQLAITSHMPNFCNVSKPNDETLKQVISRLEELGDDYKLAVCHNHPSGNTTESSFDRELTDSLDRFLRRSDGMNKFLGHIILDHDTFNLAVPSQNNPGKCHWKKMEPQIVNEVDRFTADPKPEWAGDYVGGTSALKAVAVKINDTENWNDDFIPVVFTNADRNISGVQYYSKNFFENESSQIRNEFQFAAMEAGAIVAFPVITDALWNKLGKESNDFEAVMKAHVLNDAFTDVAFNHTTMTEKYDIEAGRNYYNFYKDQSDRKIDVVSTWTPSINTRLFPPELENKKEQEIER